MKPEDILSEEKEDETKAQPAAFTPEQEERIKQLIEERLSLLHSTEG